MAAITKFVCYEIIKNQLEASRWWSTRAAAMRAVASISLHFSLFSATRYDMRCYSQLMGCLFFMWVKLLTDLQILSCELHHHEVAFLVVCVVADSE